MRFNSPEIQANKTKISSLESKHQKLFEAFNKKVGKGPRPTNLETARKVDKENPGVYDAWVELTNTLKQIHSLTKANPNTIVPRGPLVEKTDQWVQLGLKRMTRYATENGYDYVAWSPGDIQVARWNEPGLKQFYDSILPKNSNAVLKKLDKKAKVEVINVPIAPTDPVTGRAFGDAYEEAQDTLAIPITDAIRSSAPKGQPLFTPIAATAVGGGLAAQSMNQEQQ